MKEDTPTPVLEPRERPQSTLTSTDPKVVSDRYTILDILGTGGMGRVYLALDPILNRKVAVKILLYDEFSEAHIVRFQQEAKAFSQLKHSSIVNAYDFGITKDQKPFLVMEYLDGELLSEVLSGAGFLDTEQFIEIFSQIARAMAHAHKQNIVHRDLKPTNIMVENKAEGMKAFVLDFGIAKDLEQNQTLTKTGQIVGSPKYISPEQVLGKQLQASSDIYSLGCVMFEALTGRAPFVGNSAMETLEMHLEKEPPTLNQVVGYEKFTDSAEELIARLLTKDARERIQSMEELAEIIETNNFIIDRPAPKSDLVETKVLDLKVVKPDKNPHVKLAVVGSLLLIAAIVVGAYYYLSPQSPPVQTEEKKESKIEKRPFYSGDENDQLKREKKFTSYSSNDYMAIAMEELPKNTETIRLFGAVVTDKTVKFDLLQYKQLRNLDLDNVNVTPKSLVLFPAFKNLKYIRIAKTDFSKAPYRILKRLSHLEGLWLIDANLTDKDLKEIGKLKNLEILVLRNNPKITDQGLKHLATLTKLKKLELPREVTRKGLKHFSKNIEIFSKSELRYYDILDSEQ